MSEISCFDSHENYIDHLTQWDVNQVLYIKDWEYESLPVFHFCNIKSEKAIVVKGEFVDGKIMSKIPNILLQESYAIVVFVYLEEGDADDNNINNDISASQISGKSIHVFRIPVRKKPKPEDYEYEENIAYMSWVKLEQEIKDRIEMIIANNEDRFNKFENSIKELATWTFSTTGFAKKNLLKNTATDKTFNGVVTTVRKDGGIAISFTEYDGISDDSTFREFEVNSIELNPGQYTISGCPVNNGECRLVAIDTTNRNFVAIDTGDGASFTVSEKRTYRICIHVSLIEKNNSLVFYPMLRGAAITDSEYEQYVPSLQEQIKNNEAILLKLQSTVKILDEYINIILPYIIMDSGICGEDTKYSLCAEGILHVTGMGSINEKVFEKREDFREVEINIDGDVGTGAFGGCEWLNSVTVNCKKICDNAFYACPRLNHLIIEKSVSEIGSGIIFGSAFHIERGVRIEYTGTKTEWNAVTKDENWVGEMVTVENGVVICSDGTVEV